MQPSGHFKVWSQVGMAASGKSQPPLSSAEVAKEMTCPSSGTEIDPLCTGSAKTEMIPLSTGSGDPDGSNVNARVQVQGGPSEHRISGIQMDPV